MVTTKAKQHSTLLPVQLNRRSPGILVFCLACNLQILTFSHTGDNICLVHYFSSKGHGKQICLHVLWLFEETRSILLSKSFPLPLPGTNFLSPHGALSPLVESVCFRLRSLILTGLQAWHDLSPTEFLFSLPSPFLPHLPWFTPV